MKLCKSLLIAIIVLLNLVIVSPAWADRPRLTETPDYVAVTQAIQDLLQAKTAPDLAGYKPEELQQKLGDLQLQKYILETARGWAQCRNQTGKTLAVYAHKGKKANQASTLYYLGNGQMTENEWNCDGVYLPAGTRVLGLTTNEQGLAAPVAFKIVSGTQLVASVNPENSVVEFNVNPAQILNDGEGGWAVPVLTQADIDAEIPNAPIED